MKGKNKEMEIKNEEEFQKILDGFLNIPVMYTEDCDGQKVRIDTENMTEKFKEMLEELEQAVLNY